MGLPKWVIVSFALRLAQLARQFLKTKFPSLNALTLTCLL